MARTRFESKQQRQHRFEQFEQRLVMSAQAVAGLLPELEIASPALTQQVVTEPFAVGASATTQAASIAAQYGFTGAGQTVAVIDSGIAWDHYALGGGFGAGSKVVGGWDFAENDANPYDDGPAGFHGSHVAGIIGSQDSQYRGVSSGVDLVGLRVFDDNGAGDLKWVEQALQWVHEHRNDFANPITTVNLSLGTEWNAFTVPGWATLENEFAQLEADGLFISVAAGNSFQTYGQMGLSYPAVSSHVVPVASHDANGLVSDFSQRAENVLVAPGEKIKSTVPDHLFGGTSGNRFLGSTGTSMAAPYVAGASAILRQANEFMGVKNINQEMLYQQFRDSADQIYDQATGGYFYKINLESALASVVADLHANTPDSATNIGTIQNGQSISGTIGKLNDVDHFSFLAQSSGEVRLQFSSSHDLSPLVKVLGSPTEINGNEVKFSVEAGKEYKFSVASSAGNGHYNIDVLVQGGAGSVDLGNVVSAKIANQVISGESTYKLKASRDGILTIQSSAGQNQSLTMEVYDSQMNRVATRSGSGSDLRLDIVSKSGETYFLKAIGNASGVNLQIDNLVSLQNGTLSINGTNQNDTIIVDANNGISVNINGLSYQFKQADVQSVNVNGHGGQDSIDVKLGTQNDQVATTSDGLQVRNSEFLLNAFNIQTVRVDGGGGFNTVSLLDTNGDDSFQGSATASILSGAGYSSTASGFNIAYVKSTGGFDSATLQGTDQDELFVSRDQRNVLHANGAVVVAHQFDSIRIDGGAGKDRSNIFGTDGNDQFTLRPTYAHLANSEYQVWANGIEIINAMGGQGNDTMVMQDTSGNDFFLFNNQLAMIHGEGYSLVANGFKNIQANSIGGYDVAQIFDTAGNDVFTAQDGKTEFKSALYSVTTTDFDRVNAISRNGGYDRAIMVGSNGADVIYADAGSVSLTTAENLVRRAVGFEESNIDALGGNDTAVLVGSDKNDRLKANYSEVEMETTLQLLRLVNAEQTSFRGNGGVDEVAFDGMETLDLLSSIGEKATAYLKDRTVTAEDFDVLEARSVDNAIADYDLEAVDYLYMLRGKWKQR